MTTAAVLFRAPPRLQTAPGHEKHRVPCPYEPIGYALLGVAVTHLADGEKSMQIDRNTVLRCTTCRRHFGIGTRIQIVGRKIEGE